MQDFVLPPTRQTPAIELAFSAHRLRIAGDAYPENAVAFFEHVEVGDRAGHVARELSAEKHARGSLLSYSLAKLSITFR